jgi:prohead serine protease
MENARETVISFGGSVKAHGQDGEVSGYLIKFSSERDPDLIKDFFVRQTDFDTDFPGKSSVYYHHGFDKVLKGRKLAKDGKGTLEVDDVGVWVETQLALRDEYEQKVWEMAKAGKLGWSSGTAMHLVEREKVGNAHKILRWPLGLDASLTPTPCEPRNQAIVSVKTYLAELDEEAEDGLLEAAKGTPLIIDDPRALERLLRDVGLSNRAAKAVVSDGFKGLTLARCDAGEPVTQRDRLELELIRTQAEKRQRITPCQKGSGP